MIDPRRLFGLCFPLVLSSVLSGCYGERSERGGAEAEAAKAPVHETTEAVADIQAKSGSQVTGQATFTKQGDGRITVHVSIQNAPPGTHAAHIHELGDCGSEDGKSAGGHWNPMGVAHGLWGQPPFHLGDLGNIVVGENGNGNLTLTSPNAGFWSMDTGAANDVIGKAIIIHSDADDFMTQPTGNAGGRIGCGVIKAVGL